MTVTLRKAWKHQDSEWRVFFVSIICDWLQRPWYPQKHKSRSIWKYQSPIVRPGSHASLPHTTSPLPPHFENLGLKAFKPVVERRRGVSFVIRAARRLRSFLLQKQNQTSSTRIRLILKRAKVWTEQRQSDVFINSFWHLLTPAGVSGCSGLTDKNESVIYSYCTWRFFPSSAPCSVKSKP